MLVSIVLTTANIFSQGITIGSGTTLTGGSATITITGSWNNSGTYTAGSSTVIFNGSGTQTITNNSGETFNNVTINKSIGDVQLANNIAVNGTLSLIGGDLDLTGKTVSLGTSGTLSETAGNTVKGSTGTISATRTLNAPSSNNVAGLGAEITEDGNLGSCNITRGVQAQGGLGIDRYYQITTGNSPSNATLVFNYYDSELNGVTESQLALFKSSDGTSWTEQTSAELDTENNTLTLTGLDAFSYWTAAEEGSGPTLPVVLSTFTVQFIENTPTIHWSTQSENDNMGWFVYRGDENDFLTSEVISDMIEGQGTTTQQSNYVYEDNFEDTEIDSMYYYWLESIDYSGLTHHYNKVATLVIPENTDPGNNIVPEPEQFGLFQNEPNPVISSTKISFNLPETSQVDLAIYNLKGQLVKELYSGVTSKHTVMWDGKDEQGKTLESGVYLYRLLVNGKTEATKKLILMK